MTTSLETAAEFFLTPVQRPPRRAPATSNFGAGAVIPRYENDDARSRMHDRIRQRIFDKDGNASNAAHLMPGSMYREKPGSCTDASLLLLYERMQRMNHRNKQHDLEEIMFEINRQAVASESLAKEYPLETSQSLVAERKVRKLAKALLLRGSRPQSSSRDVSPPSWDSYENDRDSYTPLTSTTKSNGITPGAMMIGVESSATAALQRKTSSRTSIRSGPPRHFNTSRGSDASSGAGFDVRGGMEDHSNAVAPFPITEWHGEMPLQMNSAATVDPEEAFRQDRELGWNSSVLPTQRVPLIYQQKPVNRSTSRLAPDDEIELPAVEAMLKTIKEHGVAGADPTTATTQTVCALFTYGQPQQRSERLQVVAPVLSRVSLPPKPKSYRMILEEKIISGEIDLSNEEIRASVSGLLHTVPPLPVRRNKNTAARTLRARRQLPPRSETAPPTTDDPWGGAISNTKKTFAADEHVTERAVSSTPIRHRELDESESSDTSPTTQHSRDDFGGLESRPSAPKVEQLPPNDEEVTETSTQEISIEAGANPNSPSAELSASVIVTSSQHVKSQAPKEVPVVKKAPAKKASTAVPKKIPAKQVHNATKQLGQQSTASSNVLDDVVAVPESAANDQSEQDATAHTNLTLGDQTVCADLPTGTPPECQSAGPRSELAHPSPLNTHTAVAETVRASTQPPPVADTRSSKSSAPIVSKHAPSSKKAAAAVAPKAKSSSPQRVQPTSGRAGYKPKKPEAVTTSTIATSVPQSHDADAYEDDEFADESPIRPSNQVCESAAHAASPTAIEEGGYDDDNFEEGSPHRDLPPSSIIAGTVAQQGKQVDDEQYDDDDEFDAPPPAGDATHHQFADIGNANDEYSSDDHQSDHEMFVEDSHDTTTTAHTPPSVVSAAPPPDESEGDSYANALSLALRLRMKSKVSPRDAPPAVVLPPQEVIDMVVQSGLTSRSVSAEPQQRPDSKHRGRSRGSTAGGDSRPQYTARDFFTSDDNHNNSGVVDDPSMFLLRPTSRASADNRSRTPTAVTPTMSDAPFSWSHSTPPPDDDDDDRHVYDEMGGDEQRKRSKKSKKDKRKSSGSASVTLEGFVEIDVGMQPEAGAGASSKKKRSSSKKLRSTEFEEPPAIPAEPTPTGSRDEGRRRRNTNKGMAFDL
jgi:hypothetical protein